MKFGLVLAAMLVLTGCVAVPPPGPSDSEIVAMQERALQQTWERTGLEGDPPAVEAGPAMESEAWWQAIYDCVQERGFMITSMEWSSSSGAAIMTNSGDTIDDPETQRAFYECVAAHPLVLDERDMALTDAQLDYVYDYYQSWLVPCVIMQGYRLSDVPTRTEYRALAGQWSPFFAVDISISGADYERLERVCGAERPELY